MSPHPPGWGGLDIPAIIAADTSDSAAAKHKAPFPSPAATMGRISPLKWIYLPFVSVVSTDAEVPVIWGGSAAASTKQ